MTRTRTVPCVVCGTTFERPIRFCTKFCSRDCREERRRELDREKDARRPKDGRVRGAPVRLAAAVRALRGDSDLENWQLRERGFDDFTIAKARQATGIRAPLGVSESLLALLRETAPETYHGEAHAARRWR